MLEDLSFSAPAFEVTKSYRDGNGQMFIEGIASTTGVDLANERMSPEAIAKMAARLVGKPLRAEHQKGYLDKLGEIIQADVIKDQEGKPALWIKARLYDWSSAAKDTFNALMSGVKLGLSVAGKVNPGGLVKQLVDGLGKYVLTYIDVEPVEVSVTDHPANLETFALAVAKSFEDQEAREDEEYRKEVTNAKESKPKEYEDIDREDFLDPENYKYPIDRKHLLPALRYFNHDGQREAGGYSVEQWVKMGRKLADRLSDEMGEKYVYDAKTEKVVKEELRKEVNKMRESKLVSKKVAPEVADLVKQFGGNEDGLEVVKAEPVAKPEEEAEEKTSEATEVKKADSVSTDTSTETSTETGTEESTGTSTETGTDGSTASGTVDSLLSEVMSTLSQLKSSLESGNSATPSVGTAASTEASSTQTESEPSLEMAFEAVRKALEDLRRCWGKTVKGGASTPASTPTSTDSTSLSKALSGLTEKMNEFEKKLVALESKVAPSRKGFAIEKKFDPEVVKATKEDRLETLRKDPDISAVEFHKYRDFGIVPKKYENEWK